MDDELSTIVVVTPSERLGDVLGELNRRGGWLDDAKDEVGKFTVRARMPAHQIRTFKQWLERTTGGKGLLQVVTE